MEEEYDEEEWKNQTLHPIDGNKNKLLMVFIVNDNSEDQEIWINAKTNLAMDLAIEEAKKQKEKTLNEMIPEELADYKDVFDKKAADRFPESRSYDHAIDLEEDFIPKDCKVYPLSLSKQEKLDKFINQNLEKGYICPSKSPMASPFFFVNKKDGKLRPCQDYRRLNEGTIKNTYSLPLISELVDQLKGARYFTKLDMRWATMYALKVETNEKQLSKQTKDCSNQRLCFSVSATLQQHSRL